MKFLYLPNEPILAARQVGPRKAFARLAAEGRIGQLEIFSFLEEARTSSADEAKRKLLSLVEEFQPNILFWQHVTAFPLDAAFVSELKARSKCRLLVYHEGDPYDARVKRIDSSVAAVLQHSDLVMGVGVGCLFDLFRQHTRAPLRYLPHCFDNERFGTDWVPSPTRGADISMIANRGTRRRLRFLYLPGGRARARLATRLSETYGRDFALYGRGWDGLEASRGMVAFDGQEEAIRDSWVSVNYDHFDTIPFYFSDRLPISLAAGVPHVTSWHSGYEEMLGDCPGLYWGRSVGEIEAMVAWLLSRPRHELIEEGLGAKAWVEANLEADIVFARAFDMCIERLADR